MGPRFWWRQVEHVHYGEQVGVLGLEDEVGLMPAAIFDLKVSVVSHDLLIAPPHPAPTDDASRTQQSSLGIRGSRRSPVQALKPTDPDQGCREGPAAHTGVLRQ